ncbi:MAG: hypothetical protein HYX47_11875 [Burkholderiales bacterium]|nr:hypothetical protein [Burkholderiales bacterium]
MTTQSSPFSLEALAPSGAGHVHGSGSTLTMREPRVLLGEEMPQALFMSGIAGVEGAPRDNALPPDIAAAAGTITLTY